tara:strand:+ start:509 stop:916 length:408 start_codon:yes stop_codon:yes gene_type:complete
MQSSNSLEQVFKNQEQLNEFILPGINHIIQNKTKIKSEQVLNNHLQTQWFVSFLTKSMAKGNDSLKHLDWDLSIDDMGSQKWRNKRTGHNNNWDSVKDELITTFGWFVSVCLVAKITPDELINGYFNQNKLPEDK